MKYPSRFAREVAEKAGEMGYTMSLTGSGHLRLTKDGLPGCVTASATPSCPFALKNVLGDLKRHSRGHYARSA